MGVLAFGIVWTLMLLSRPSIVGSAKDEYRTRTSTEAAPANRVGWRTGSFMHGHSLVASLGNLEDVSLNAALRTAFDIRRAARDVDPSWQDTHVALDSLLLAEEARRSCAELAMQIQDSCWVRMDNVLVRTAATSARIEAVFVRPPTSEERASTDVDSPRCPEYVQCVAASRLGESVPFPSTAADVVSATQFTRFSWPTSGKAFVPEVALAMATQIEASCAAARRRGPADPDERVKLAELEDLATYLRQRAEREGVP